MLSHVTLLPVLVPTLCGRGGVCLVDTLLGLGTQQSTKYLEGTHKGSEYSCNRHPNTLRPGLRGELQSLGNKCVAVLFLGF